MENRERRARPFSLRFHIRHVAPTVAVLLRLWTPALAQSAPADDPSVRSAIVHPAENADPNPDVLGERPYEMAGRSLGCAPLFDFTDVANWEVEGQRAEGWLYRSRDQQLFADHCGKLVYVGKGENPAIIVRPARPIPIPDPWETVTFWNYGNAWGWSPRPDTPFLHLSALLRDAAGQDAEINLGVIDYQYWFLSHGRLNAGQIASLQRPLSFVGFKVTGGTNAEKRTIYLGPCCFYQEEIKPLQFDPWPEELPFPTRPETILPTNNVTSFHNEVRQDGETTVFIYDGDDCTIEYRYVPRDGTLNDIELHSNGKVIHPCAGGGIQLAGPDGPIALTDASIQRELKEYTLSDDRPGIHFGPVGDGLPARRATGKMPVPHREAGRRATGKMPVPHGEAGRTLRVVWSLRHGELATNVTYELRILQKSLIVEMSADAPVVERVLLGGIEPAPEAKTFKIPYLTFGWGNTDPLLAYTDGLFLFLMLDWYHSDASKLLGPGDLRPNAAIINGGALYTPKTDGRRNLLRERLFINVSPEVHEVFPTIPNPPSPFQAEQGSRLWRVKGGHNHEAEIAEATQLRQLGCEHVTIRYHEDSWRDAGESFTFRLNAAPGRGGDEALKKFVSAVQSLGWRVGLYTNYIDFAPVNAYWDPDHVIRNPDTTWQRAWMRCYAAKPMWGVQMQALLAPQIQAKFGTDHSYCDVHTVFMPCEREDYDARVPGAATFRRTYECYGRLLYNEKFAYGGPVYSEGRNHWIYAGLTDGNYAQLASDAPPYEPLFVDFDLLKIHPLEMDAGMGAPGMFFKNATPDLDQFIATTLAYGHIGFLEWSTTEGLLKIYNMLQPLQRHYAMVPVRSIQYDDNGKMVDTSKALVSGAYRNNRVRVEYESGLVVYVNGSQEPWTVERELVLPPWGYFVERDDGCSISVIAPVGFIFNEFNGPLRRLDLSMNMGRYYADTRGSYFSFEGAYALEGSAFLDFSEDSKVMYLTPATRFVDAGIGSSTYLRVAALAADDSAVESPELRWSRDMLHILPRGEKALRYRIETDVDRPAPAMVVAETLLVQPGEVVEAKLPADVDVQAPGVAWEIDDLLKPAGAKMRERQLTFKVPDDVKEAQHLWLRIPAENDTLWLDFIVGVVPQTQPAEAP